jgi:uncharacterized membrane protein YuzA (DUF378 family)
MNNHNIYVIAIILLIIGGLNWGLVGLFQLNIVEVLFGFYPIIARLIYVVVGLSAIYVGWVEFVWKRSKVV